MHAYEFRPGNNSTEYDTDVSFVTKQKEPLLAGFVLSTYLAPTRSSTSIKAFCSSGFAYARKSKCRQKIEAPGEISAFWDSQI